MSRPRLARLDPKPDFNPDAYLRIAQAEALPQADLAAMAALWPRFLGALSAWRIEADDGGPWLLAWLGEDLEREIEGRFATSPARGFLEHALAVHALMAAAAAVVPELAEHGCAPVPAAHRAVSEAVASLGLDWPEPGTLARRYALLTPTAFAGGCADCALAGDCPRLRTPTPAQPEK